MAELAPERNGSVNLNKSRAVFDSQQFDFQGFVGGPTNLQIRGDLRVLQGGMT